MKLYVFTSDKDRCYELDNLYLEFRRIIDKKIDCMPHRSSWFTAEQIKSFGVVDAQKHDLFQHPLGAIRYFHRQLYWLRERQTAMAIITHSDYLIKELNNCLMLSNDFLDKEAFMKEYGYENYHILHPHEVEVYIGTERVEIGKFGMKKSAFDEAIKRFNEISDTLFNILG